MSREVIVVGNGFDLNQGLKTSYRDFIESDNFRVLVNNNKLMSFLENRYELQRWIDVENELKIYSTFANEGFHRDYNSLCDALINYMKGVSDSVINLSPQSFKLLQSMSGKDFTILDFNYTDTTARILSYLEYSEEEISRRIIKVHGSALDGEIIFGIEDEVPVKESHVFLKKAYHKKFRAIDFRKFFGDCYVIHFIGHSLGETDQMYFRDFFLNGGAGFNGSKQIFLYHYGALGYTQLLGRIDALTNHQLSKFKRTHMFHTIDISST